MAGEVKLLVPWETGEGRGVDRDFLGALVVKMSLGKVSSSIT